MSIETLKTVDTEFSACSTEAISHDNSAILACGTYQVVKDDQGPLYTRLGRLLVYDLQSNGTAIEMYIIHF